MSLHRRAFLKTAVSAALALSSARLVSTAGATTTGPADDGLVRLLIDTDRDRLPEQLVARIRSGLEASFEI